MKRTIWMMPALFLIGCSTSPVADFLDHFWPAKPPANAAGAYGGVCNTPPAGPGVAGGPVAPGAPPGLAPTTILPGNAPVVPAPGTNAPNNNAPYIPGGTSPPPPLGTGALPAPDLNGIPTSGSPMPAPPSGDSGQPLPTPPSSNAPPF